MDPVSFISYLINHFSYTVLPVLIGIAISIVVHYSVKHSLRHTRLSGEIRESAVIAVRGPVAVAIIGFAVGLAGYSNPSLFPSYLSEGLLLLVIELLVLLASINAARKISGILFKSYFRKGGASRKLLLMGVYSLGLVTLFYIVLISPLETTVESDAFPAIAFITGVIITYLIAYIANLLILRYQSMIKEKQPQLNTIITFGRRVIMGVLVLIGVSATAFAAFPGASGAVASLLVAAGFTSIVIGLAAQSSLSNLIAGMVISTSQPFRVGDALSYAGEWAWVEDLKLTFTILRTWDNRRLVVPNQMFLSTTMINYDYGDSTKLCIVYVTITYESDLDKAIGILKEIAREHPDFLPQGNLPVVHVMDFTDGHSLDGVYLRLLSRAKDQPTNFQMSKDILYEVKKRFDANGIHLAYPRRQIVMDEGNRGYAAPTNSDPNATVQPGNAFDPRTEKEKERDNPSEGEAETKGNK